MSARANYSRRRSSGERVPLRGRAFIALSLTPADAHNAHGHSVYRGPTLRQYHLQSLRGVVLTGDFEGTVSFGIALRGHDTFRVSVLHAPNRLVVDLHH